MKLQWIPVLLALLTICSSNILPQSKISLINNQYQGITIALSPDITEGFGIQIILSLKDIFKKASNILELATRKITSFGKITIIVPNSWKNTSGLIEDIHPSTSFHLAAFRIDTPHPVYGDEPYTLQPQQCGDAGLYIHLTPDFILKNSFTGKDIELAAKKLVQNWVRYRYGVFPETGDHYRDHLHFPTFYVTEDGPKPTGCNDQPLDVDWAGDCHEGSRDCSFIVNDRQNEGLSTSLMSWSTLRVDSFCDKTNHNFLAPTIHNALCQSRSVWEVLQDHEDFRTNRAPIGATPLNTPDFQIVKNGPPLRCIIIIDTSSDSKNKVKLTTILPALNRFIMLYLPNHAEVAVIHYSDKLYFTKNVTSLDHPKNRDIVRRTFLKYRESRNKATTVRALERAFELFFTDAGGVCVLLSSGRYDNDFMSEERVENLKTILHGRPITLTALILGEAKEGKQIPNIVTSDILQTLTKLSAGQFLAIHEKQTSIDMLIQADGLLLQAAKQMKPQLIQIAHQVIQAGILAEGFYIDEDCVNDMVFSITLEHELWPVVLTSPTGEQVQSQHEGYSDNENLKLVSITVPNAQTGKWTYRVLTEHTNQTSAITVTSLTTQKKPIELQGWISVKKSNVSTWPVKVYGKLMKGSNPVLSAKVIAYVIGNTDISITLFDIGNGDPDVFKDDGVYSRYIPGHLKMGFYTVWLTASDNGTSKTSERESNIKKQTGPFQRITYLGSFYVGHSGDVCPPNRIADLHYISASRNKVRLRWTEPGDDFDSGKVARYRFWWSEKIDCLTLVESSCKSELYAEVEVRPKGSGNHQTADILLPSMPRRVMYVAIIAEDTAYNPSPVSNVIVIFWNQVHPSLDVVQSSASKMSQAFQATRKRCNFQCLPGSSLVVVIVGATIIALVLVALVLTMCIMERRRTVRNQNPILRPRLDIRPNVGCESASPEMIASSTSNGESDNQAIIMDQENNDVSNGESEKKEGKEPSKKCPTDDVLTYRPLLDERKQTFSILHNPNCSLINSNIT